MNSLLGQYYYIVHSWCPSYLFLAVEAVKDHQAQALVPLLNDYDSLDHFLVDYALLVDPSGHCSYAAEVETEIVVDDEVDELDEVDVDQVGFLSRCS